MPQHANPISDTASTNENANKNAITNQVAIQGTLNWLGWLGQSTSTLLTSFVRSAMGYLYTHNRIKPVDDSLTPLHISVITGTLEEINECAKNRSYHNKQNSMGCTALHLAILNRREEAVLALINQGVFIDIPDIQGNTPIQLAAQYGTPNMVSALLEAGSHPNMEDYRNRSSLLKAIESKHNNVEKLQLLIVAGADVTAKAYGHETIYDVAVRKGLKSKVDEALSVAYDQYRMDNEDVTNQGNSKNFQFVKASRMNEVRQILETQLGPLNRRRKAFCLSPSNG